ncbi:hypothetical protein [Acetobacterium malicum]|uniref:hypothetical protein n=1 Tax=Acetobacterium malicum TaxID=52692 RepID=UPI0003F7B117|nr:hypothetical protein [Acetobacterium dehalogenans]
MLKGGESIADLPPVYDRDESVTIAAAIGWANDQNQSSSADIELETGMLFYKNSLKNA